ncbi:MAG: 30S ribosomal protein S13 [Nanoarchaeota archaeon]
MGITKEPQTMQETKQEERIVRILSKDIEGRMRIYPGLTKIKGISWSMANAICISLKLDKNRKIGSLTEQEIHKINDFVKNPKLPIFLVNRKFDPETGKDRHLIGSDLDLRHEFDIKKLKKIKSYRGLRHTLGQPVRGQRTKAHFRKNRRKSAGINKKKK